MKALISGLFEFDQGSGKILGMKENHGFPVGAGARLAVAKHPCAFRDELVSRMNNIVDFETQVMDAARAIAVEKAADR